MEAFFNAVLVVFFLVYGFFKKEVADVSVIWRFAYLVMDIFWCFVFYRIVKSIQGQLELDTERYETDGVVTLSYQIASRWQRFLNSFFDRLFAILILPAYLFFVLGMAERGSRRYSEDGSTDKLKLFILIDIAILVYYVLNEGLLGTTPAKFLTGTHLGDENGNRPKLGKVLIRSISRFVPFEALSCFGRGWHDSWSNTYVLKYKNRGVHAACYFLLVPAIALLVWLVPLGLKSYDKYLVYKKEKREYDANMERCMSRYKNLSNECYVKLATKNYYGNANANAYYLKVDEVKPDSIVFTKLFFDESYSSRNGMLPLAARDSLVQGKGQGRFAMARSSFEKALGKEYSNYDNNEPPYIEVDGIKLDVKDIFDLSMPELRFDNGSYDYNAFREGSSTYLPLTLSLKNYGKSLEVVSFAPADTSQRWRQENSSIYNYVTLNGNRLKTMDSYKLELVVRTLNGKQRKYLIDGKGRKPALKEMPMP